MHSWLTSLCFGGYAKGKGRPGIWELGQMENQGTCETMETQVGGGRQNAEGKINGILIA